MFLHSSYIVRRSLELTQYYYMLNDAEKSSDESDETD